VKLVSWNVNGLRSAWKKGFPGFLTAQAADLVCVQETKLQAEQVTDEMRAPGGYSSHWAFAERPGYSGVVTYSRAAPLAASIVCDHPVLDCEGRLVHAHAAGEDFAAFDLSSRFFRDLPNRAHATLASEFSPTGRGEANRRNRRFLAF